MLRPESPNYQEGSNSVVELLDSIRSLFEREGGSATLQAGQVFGMVLQV